MNIRSLPLLYLLLIFLQLNVSASAYKILGKSSKIPQEKMKLWQEKIAKMANCNPESIIINGPTNQKVVALTFDDGPDTKITPLILDVLKKYRIKATFFFIGNQVKQYKKIVSRTKQEGHLVLNHSYSHPSFSKLTSDQIQEEVKRTEGTLNSAIGKVPPLIRVPYGSINNIILQTLKDLNYKLIFWSLDTFDWSEMQKNAIINNVIQNVRPGEIILMHSNANKTATYEALPTIIKKLKHKGYNFTTVDHFVS